MSITANKCIWMAEQTKGSVFFKQYQTRIYLTKLIKTSRSGSKTLRNIKIKKKVFYEWHLPHQVLGFFFLSYSLFSPEQWKNWHQWICQLFPEPGSLGQSKTMEPVGNSGFPFKQLFSDSVWKPFSSQKKIYFICSVGDCYMHIRKLVWPDLLNLHMRTAAFGVL